VDAVSHLIFGRALAAIAPRPADADTPRRGLTAATVIASIVPDADAVLMPFGWDRYLLWHQRGTHALIGTLADAIVFALLLRVLLDWWPWPRGERAPAARLPHLVLAAWLGCLGHVLLDVISGGTIRLFAPFSAAPYGVPWMAMADPLIAMPLAIFLIASWRWRRRQPERVARFAWMVMITLAAIVGVKEISRRAAIDVYARSTEGQPGVQSPAIESAWASFTRWFVYDRTLIPPTAVTPDSITLLRVHKVDAWSGNIDLLFQREARPPANEAAALVQASTQLETVRHLHALFELTFAEIRPHQRDGGSTNDGQLVDVLWSDIRFCWPTDCALWFGGTFDQSTGALQEQVVLVGSLRQTRKR
jgi:membrane-bound metal-dependent hydrolase YbcI (DUF457 family)